MVCYADDMDKLRPGQIHSYILRLWVEGETEAGPLRASLTLIPAGERIGFSSLAALLDYLTQVAIFQKHVPEGDLKSTASPSAPP